MNYNYDKMQDKLRTFFIFVGACIVIAVIAVVSVFADLIRAIF